MVTIFEPSVHYKGLYCVMFRRKDQKAMLRLLFDSKVREEGVAATQNPPKGNLWVKSENSTHSKVLKNYQKATLRYT